jgi:Xaa-Pro aminopeptidase
MDYACRLKTLRKAMSTKAVQGFAVSEFANIRYLTGFTGSSALVFVTATQAYLFTDSRYTVQSKEEVWAEYGVILIKKGLWKDLIELLKKEKNIENIGFEADQMIVSTYETVKSALVDKKLISTQSIVEDIRICKEGAELELIKKAAEISDATFNLAKTLLVPGVSELSIARQLEQHMLTLGAEKTSFPTIAASGARGALPHAHPTDNILKNGDLVTIDMGAVYAGYASDCTRTYIVGTPTEEQQRVYKAVYEAEQASITACAPQVVTCEVDAAARLVLASYDLEEYFTHALGHGVGLDIHEAPTLSHHSESVLKPGMVITCEPGVYREGWGGVRIEDMVLITDNGYEILTRADNPSSI